MYKHISTPYGFQVQEFIFKTVVVLIFSGHGHECFTKSSLNASSRACNVTYFFLGGASLYPSPPRFILFFTSTHNAIRGEVSTVKT